MTFDPSEVGLSTLVDIHIQTHAAFSNHSMRSKYRSAVYTFDERSRNEAKAGLDRVAKIVGKAPTTKVLDFVDFKPSDPRFHNYYKEGADRPFCRAYIHPKIAKLKKIFPDYVASD